MILVLVHAVDVTLVSGEVCRGLSPPATYSILQLLRFFLILRSLVFLLELEVLLFVDEVGDLISSFEEAFPHLDEVEEVVDAGEFMAGANSGWVAT